MAQSYDLFVSYSSKDRPWALRFYEDMRRSYPWLKIFFDRDSLPAGADWQPALVAAAKDSKHQVVFWSKNARESAEVYVEIVLFKDLLSKSADGNRTESLPFYFIMGEKLSSPVASKQGFSDFERYYDPNAPDMGVSNLDTTLEANGNWRRALRMIGDSVAGARNAVPVSVLLVTLTQSRLPFLDTNEGSRLGKGPTLREFLGSYQLTWSEVRDRYAESGFDWKPYGATETIIEALEALRVDANSRLDSVYHFRWDYIDINDEVTVKRLRAIPAPPLVAILDPVALYHPEVAETFRDLESNLYNDFSVVVSLSPVGELNVDWLREVLKPKGLPVLKEFFEPRIPPLNQLPHCAVDIRRISDLEPIVRRRIGLSYKDQKMKEALGTVAMGSL